MIEELAAQEKETARLTHLAACGGCASKLSQSALADVLQGLPQYPDSRMLVGNATSDDAGVFRISEDQALVQTVDFFTPIVDDPFTFGQIAATNALSDVYAMGGRPLTALAITGMPDEALEPEVIREILRGGAEKAVEAQCSILGGHTIKNPQPIYGLACTGIVNPGCYMANAAARPGDVLVLTKPLGTGIITSRIGCESSHCFDDDVKHRRSENCRTEPQLLCHGRDWFWSPRASQVDVSREWCDCSLAG